MRLKKFATQLVIICEGSMIANKLMRGGDTEDTLLRNGWQQS